MHRHCFPAGALGTRASATRAPPVCSAPRRTLVAPWHAPWYERGVNMYICLHTYIHACVYMSSGVLKAMSMQPCLCSHVYAATCLCNHVYAAMSMQQ